MTLSNIKEEVNRVREKGTTKSNERRIRRIKPAIVFGFNTIIEIDVL